MMSSSNSRKPEEEGEAGRRRQPQSLNQKNAELLQNLARLRAQRLSALSDPHLNQNSSASESAGKQSQPQPQSQPKSMEPEAQNNGKNTGKVRVAGRRRLCKASNDDITLSSHCLVSNESATSEKDDGGYSEGSNAGCQGFSIKQRQDKISSKNDLDEINSRLGSLSIKSSKRVEHSITAELDNAEPRKTLKNKILDASNYFKDGSDSECDEESGAEVEVRRDKVNSICDEESAGDEEYTGHVEDSEDGVDTLVHSSDAPEFESALSALSSASVKVGDGEEDSAESSRCTELHTGNDNRDHNQAITFVSFNAKHVHGISSETDAKLRPSKGIKQMTKPSKSFSAVAISSSVDEDNSGFSEDENSSLDSAESVKVQLKKHALTTKENHAQNVYEYEDVSSSSAEEVALEESKAITFTKGKQTYRLPGKIATTLYPHQREGIKWLWDLHCKSRGGILGDDMGLGKTMQLSSFLAGLFTSCLIKRALIVAPKTVLPNWMKELSIVGLSRKVRDFSGSPGSTREYALQHVLQTGGILLTTYDVVRNNWKAIRGDYHGRDGYGDTSEDIVTWDYVILDEGHIIKNPNTQRATSLREIPSAHRIIVSGTPIQNNLKEMWALFDFCCPELLGDKKDFKARYEDLILHANDKRATQRQKWIGSKAAQELRERIQPYFLRRLKSEVFPQSGDSSLRKLAKKDDIIVWLKLTACQRQLYTAFLNSETAHSSVEGSALAALTVLKKICDHPGLLTKRAADDIAEGMESMIKGAGVTEEEEIHAEVAAAEEMAASLASMSELENGEKKHGNASCKIVFLMALLDKLIAEDHRVLVFSQTRKMLNIIQEEVRSKGYDFLRIDGTTKASDREKFVNEFQAYNKIPIFLLTSQVGGLGITLTGADRVVIVDPAWNPSTDNQSVDRAYRIGQLRNVLVYRLITCGTIEEKIYRKQVFKGGLFKTATEHKQQTRYFSHQELHELFSIPESGFDVSLTQQQLHEEHDSQHEIDALLKQHIEFLEGQGIAGVSHHSLLYSKTESVQSPPPEDNDMSKWDPRRKQYIEPISRYPTAKSSRDDIVNGSEYAFRPKDLKPVMRETPPAGDDGKENAIKENIRRLSQILADEAVVSKLPDKGENLKRKMKDLTNQLKNLENISSRSRVIVVPESSPVSVISDDKVCVISPESEGKKMGNVASSIDNSEKERKESCSKSCNVINIDDMSKKLGRLSVQGTHE